MRPRIRTGIVLLLLLAPAACSGADGAGIPAKTVVLTFDDACRSHLDVVAPVLEEHGFGATFFATRVWMENRRDYLNFAELRELHRRGFEIGSHSWTHAGFHLPDATQALDEDLDLLEGAFAKVGIPKPASFAWPGGVFGPEGRAVLEARGYEFARRVIHPEYGPGITRQGLVYDPSVHDPFLIPTYGLVNDTWSPELFASVVAKATAGRAVVLGFHGVPDPANRGLSTSPRRFRGMMDQLKQGGYRVVAVRDLSRWVDPAARPDDPLVTRRCPE